MRETRKTYRGAAQLLAVFAITAGVLGIAGSASARYLKDGSVPDGTGTWKLPSDMVCINGIATDGTITLVPGVANSRDCIYWNTGLTAMAPVDISSSSNCGLAGTTLCNTQALCLHNGTSSSSPASYDFATKGQHTWVGATSTSGKCYDNAPCVVAGLTAGNYGTSSVAYPANTGGKHSVATSICVDGSGNGLSLTELDRTAQMCAARGGTWKQTSATPPQGITGTFPTSSFGGACVAYGRQFAGQDPTTGAPLTLTTGTQGTTWAQGASGSFPGVGFCYTTMTWSSTLATPISDCPSNKAAASPFDNNAAYDWSWTTSGAKCNYSKSVAGLTNAIAVKADGSQTPAGTYVDLSGTSYDTMGECLAAGFSWNNWVGYPAGGLTSVTGADTNTYKRPAWDYQKEAPDADDGCLHCHSTTVEYNGPAERFKSSYLMTGHKNMLRKAVAGQTWKGPDSDGVLQPYTDYAAGSINWATPSAQVSGVDKPLLYIFGDWMAPAPGGLDVIVNMSGTAKYNGASNYSCAACHSTGFANAGSGICSKSQYTTSATCTSTTANGIWYPMVGVMNVGTSSAGTVTGTYVPQDPAASFPTVTFAGAGMWDFEGITCGRCHNAAVGPVNATAIAATKYTTTYPTSGGMGNIPGGPEGGALYATFLCYGCHQSIAKTSNGVGLDNDLDHPEYLPVKNTVTAPLYVPGFNSHVIGGEFLNSPHARATAHIQPNALGKYDLITSGASAITFNSTFVGYTCWQGSTSSSPALTRVEPSLATQAACEADEGEWLPSGGCVLEIKDKTTCEGLYGAGAWRGPVNPGAAVNNGSCATCHDVHNSLFVAGQREKAQRKTCESCHVNNLAAVTGPVTGATVATAPQIVPANINHLHGLGTPFDTSLFEESCVVCHMPKPTSADFPMHVMRINPDPTYSTFPDACEFGVTCANATQKNANMQADDDSYASAVWVDVDIACGQCHGGSAGPTATKYDAPYRTKEALAAVAEGIHDASGAVYQVTFSTGVTGLTVNAAAAVNCGGTCPTLTYDWYWGDAGHDTVVGTATKSHTYATAGVWTINLVVSAGGKNVGQVSRTIRVQNIDTAPTANATCTWTANTWNMQVVDSSTDLGASPVQTVVVDWGDGTLKSFGVQNGTFNHVYLQPGNYTVTLRAIDTALNDSTFVCVTHATPGYFTIQGTVSVGAAALPSARLTLSSGSTVVKSTFSASDGTYKFSGLAPGAYTMQVAKSSYAFASSPYSVTVGPSATQNVSGVLALRHGSPRSGRR